MEDLKVHCGKNIDDPWHDMFNIFLEFRVTSDSEEEDDNDSTAESVQGDKEQDHNNDEGTNGDSQDFFLEMMIVKMEMTMNVLKN